MKENWDVIYRRWRNRFGPIEKRPIFILGNQKSGTSAIVNLLASATASSFTNDFVEIYEPAQANLHEGKITLRKFISQTRYPFSKKLIKEPSLTFLYPQLAQVYRDARYIFVVRNPADNIRSILDRLKMPGTLRVADLEPFGMSINWKRIVDSRWLGAKGDHYIEWLAHRWCLAAEIYLKAASSMTLVKYEDFIPDKKSCIEKLAGRLGLKVRHDISAEVDIQFQPKGNAKVDKQVFFGENLEVIHRICASRMREFGYVLP